MAKDSVEWKVSEAPVGYEEALAFMDAQVAGIHEGREPECVWLLEHPALYTAGTSAKDGDLLDERFPVFKTGRGGEYIGDPPAASPGSPQTAFLAFDQGFGSHLARIIGLLTGSGVS